MTDLPDFHGSQTDHLHLILEAGGIGVWELDVRTGSAWRNLRHDQIFGYDVLLSEWSYETFLNHVVPEDRDAVDALYGSALAQRKTWSFECRIVGADGERRWISATGRPVRDESGEVVRLIGHVIDITHAKRNEEHLRTVLNELNHRVRNMLAVIQALAQRSFPDGIDVAEGREAFIGRIHALAQAHSVMTDEAWSGAKMADLVAGALAPYGGDGRSCDFSGPPMWLSSKVAVNLAMTLNELTTNALKHGALSVPEGRVGIHWSPHPDKQDVCELLWTESGGPPVVEPTRQGFGRQGFGMTLIGMLLPSTGGVAEVAFAPGGLRCRLEIQGCRPVAKGSGLP